MAWRGVRWMGRSSRIGWPAGQLWPGSHFVVDQVASGLRAAGARVELREIRAYRDDVLLAELDDGDATFQFAVDFDDLPDVADEVADQVLVYFKHQFAAGGYGRDNVIPAGYLPANKLIYRYLPLLRSLRATRRFRYDVHGRFGLRYGGVEMRKQAVEILSSRTDFSYQGGLFRYSGGPDKPPYRDYLFEIPRARVCVDMPGKGDLCHRLVDYMAVGACVVTPPHGVELPVPLLDGVHVVRCAADLSDLGDICAELLRDDETRERIARNARDYFDRHLHPRALAGSYLARLEHAREATSSLATFRRSPPAPVPLGARARRTARPVLAAAASCAILFGIFVALPERLGDRPYNALGRDSRNHPTQPTPRSAPASPSAIAPTA
jgi:Glycosyl transferases group 1